MTAESKTSIKAYFQEGDKPTEGQFENLIDSYEDTSQVLAALSAAVSAGVSGVPIYSDASTASMFNFGSAGRALASAGTQASAISFLAPISASNFDSDWIASLSADTPVSADLVVFGDANDSNNQKQGTVQQILDLVSSTTVSAATQAEMEAASSTTVYASPGRTQYHPGVAKCWINFNGTGTIATRVSHNVTSITDNGTGHYTITIATDFSSGDYCAVSMGQRNSTETANVTVVVNIRSNHTPLAGSMEVNCGAGTNQAVEDLLTVSVAILGDQ